jgi:amidase
MPPVDVDRYFSDYLALLGAMTTTSLPRPARQAAVEVLTAYDSFIPSAIAAGMLLDAADYVALLDRRERVRFTWQRFFDDWDVVLAPTTLDVAFPHQTGSVYERTLEIDHQPVPYLMNFAYVFWATFAGLPATTFPAGVNRDGLPIGLQVVGPYLEDRTTLRFAQLLERDWHRFQAPPLTALVEVR